MYGTAPELHRNKSVGKKAEKREKEKDWNKRKPDYKKVNLTF